MTPYFKGSSAAFSTPMLCVSAGGGCLVKISWLVRLSGQGIGPPRLLFLHGWLAILTKFSPSQCGDLTAYSSSLPMSAMDSAHNERYLLGILKVDAAVQARNIGLLRGLPIAFWGRS